MLYYQRQGRLRSDLRITGPPGAASVFARTGAQPFVAGVEAADFAVLQYRQTGFVTNPSIARLLSGSPPVRKVTHRGVPLMALYER